MTQTIAFAVPGDIHTLTGGYLYDLNLMRALESAGMSVTHLAWGSSFPVPNAQDAQQAVAQLQALGADVPAMVDGLAFGALDTDALGRVTAPLFALVHHPLALEPGLDPARAAAMAQREQANLALARHIFVTSPHTAAILRAQYGVAPDRVTVVLPGFARPAAHAVQKADPPLILSVGILARRKGHDILLRALAQITDLDWQADIVGRDHEAGMTTQLQTMIADLGLGARVRLLGEVDRADLEARYRSAAIFALATRYEGYGIVFGEAMGHGLPIVSTLAGAVPETVGDKAGSLVPPDDPTAFAAALRRMLEQPDARQDHARASFAAAGRLARWEDAAALVRAQIFP
jgi:glycosyltransferase involved in cell wall biosynthesis